MSRIISTSVLFLLFFLASTGIHGQSNRDSILIEKVVALQDAETVEALTELVNWLKEDKKTNNRSWYHAYYIALGDIKMARLEEGNEAIQDEYCNDAEKYVEEAIKISPQNDEILTLKGFLLSTQISIAPMLRGPMYGPLARKTLLQALSINHRNPRCLTLKADGKSNSPVFFGGGCKSARPFIKKADEIFYKSSFKKSLDPKWGYRILMAVKERCS